VFDFKARQKAVKGLATLPRTSGGGSTFVAHEGGGLDIFQEGSFSNSTRLSPAAVEFLKAFIEEVYG